MRRRLTLIVLGCAAVLAGCAASAGRSQADAQPIGVAPAAAQRIVLQLRLPPGGSADEDWQAFRDEWQTSMSAAASARGARFQLLKDGESPGAQAGTLLRMQVNSYRYVSQARRSWLGAFSGNAALDVSVEAVELPSGRSAGSRQYSTSSSAWQGVFSAMTPRQVEAVSQDLVAAVQAR